MTTLTLTQIADIIARADNLNADEHKQLRSRLHNFEPRRMFGGRSTDGRGRLSFDLLELFRFRVVSLLADLNITGEILDHVADAMDCIPLGGRPAPSQRGPNGGYFRRAALADAVRGVAAGEPWSLVISRFPGTGLELDGLPVGENLRVTFTYAGEGPVEAVRAVDGARPLARVEVDLAVAFAPLIALVGVPQ